MNTPIMFSIGCVIFFAYLYALLRAIHWGHNSQREDMMNDPEMRNYYSRHGMPDNMDYDGMGNYGRFPSTEPKKRKRKTTKSKTKTKEKV
jgi:hypothetical protein